MEPQELVCESELPEGGTIETETETAKPKLNLTEEQLQAVDFVLDNLDSGLVALAGPAGSGKTTITKHIVERLHNLGNQVTVSAATNKAAVVLRNKGISACTLHQACMKPRFRPPLSEVSSFLERALREPLDTLYAPRSLRDEYGAGELRHAQELTISSGVCSGLRHLGIKDMFKYLEGWSPAEPSNAVLIIDEASMIGDVELDIARKVYSRIILVGDEFQLPPVQSKPVFWDVKRRIALNHIHRQAEGSQPLELATKIRTKIPVAAEPVLKVDVELSRAGYPVIVWRNKTREALTGRIREKLGFDKLGPQVGEYLICRNAADRAAKSRGLINNTLWKVIRANGYRVDLENDQGDILEDENVFIEELDQGLGPAFRFAYALTAHNSQGSEWPKVMIHEPDAVGFFNFKPDEARHWLYTAITRAANEVIWINGV